MGVQKSARTLYESRETTVDYDTGEVREETIVTESKIPSEPPYVKLYIDDLGSILGLEKGEKRVLLSLACSIDYEGSVSVTSTRRQRLAERCQLSVKSFNNAISALATKGLIKVIGRGEYELNPKLFAKGDWRQVYARRRAFQLQVTYSEKGRSIETTSAPQADQPDLLEKIQS